jgi:hypothetical protein
VKLEGQFTTGRIVSRLLTTKVQGRLLPARSVAEQVTEVLPGGNEKPLELRIASCVPQLIVTTPVSSVAETVAVTTTLG